MCFGVTRHVWCVIRVPPPWDLVSKGVFAVGGLGAVRLIEAEPYVGVERRGHGVGVGLELVGDAEAEQHVVVLVDQVVAVERAEGSPPLCSNRSENMLNEII
jgi:hypothetical protein